MPYEKHGKYDTGKGLPDNTGQAQGSGLIVWLHEQIAEHWPDLLAYAKQQHDPNSWILNRLSTTEDEQGQAIYAEYVRRRRAIQAEQRWRDRKRELEDYRAQLDVETSPGRLMFIRTRIKKLESMIEKAERKENHEKF